MSGTTWHIITGRFWNAGNLTKIHFLSSPCCRRHPDILWQVDYLCKLARVSGKSSVQSGLGGRRKKIWEQIGKQIGRYVTWCDMTYSPWLGCEFVWQLHALSLLELVNARILNEKRNCTYSSHILSCLIAAKAWLYQSEITIQKGSRSQYLCHYYPSNGLCAFVLLWELAWQYT